jgi:hypothetical protein
MLACPASPVDAAHSRFCREKFPIFGRRVDIVVGFAPRTSPEPRDGQPL